MQNVKEFIRNKKGLLVICLIVVVLIVAILIIVSSKSSEAKEEGNKLEVTFKEMGKDFYENQYYSSISSEENKREEFLKKYQDLGLKLTLGDLIRISDDSEEKEKIFVNDKGEACDKTRSILTIFPKEPYKKDSYTVEVNLVCETQKEDENKEEKKDETPKEDTNKKENTNKDNDKKTTDDKKN